MRTLVISLAIGFLVATTATAADCGACPGAKQCGQGDCGDCKVACGVKLVKRHVWVVECSKMCPSLPGCDRCRDRCCKSGGCGKACDAGCDAGCGNGCKEDPCESLKDRKYVPPKCMKSRCIKKLVKKEVLCEVPAYKCVPVGCAKPAAACGGCSEASDAGEATPDEGAPEEAPPAPAAPGTETAPEPPVVGTAYLEALKLDR